MRGSRVLFRAAWSLFGSFTPAQLAYGSSSLLVYVSATPRATASTSRRNYVEQNSKEVSLLQYTRLPAEKAEDLQCQQRLRRRKLEQPGIGLSAHQRSSWLNGQNQSESSEKLLFVCCQELDAEHEINQKLKDLMACPPGQSDQFCELGKRKMADQVQVNVMTAKSPTVLLRKDLPLDYGRN